MIRRIKQFFCRHEWNIEHVEKIPVVRKNEKYLPIFKVCKKCDEQRVAIMKIKDGDYNAK